MHLIALHILMDIFLLQQPDEPIWETGISCVPVFAVQDKKNEKR